MLDRGCLSLSFLKTLSAAEILAFQPLPDTVYGMQTIVVIRVTYVREIVLSRARLQLENIALRQQVAVLKRDRPQPWLHPLDRESIIGTHFLGEMIETTRVADTRAVVTSVAGQAWITSIGQYGYDPTDPFPEGYTLSDTWLGAI